MMPPKLLVWRAYDAVLRAAESDRKFATRVIQAARRVLQFKRRARELHVFVGEPKARTVNNLKEMVQDFSRIVEEHRS